MALGSTTGIVKNEAIKVIGEKLVYVGLATLGTAKPATEKTTKIIKCAGVTEKKWYLASAVTVTEGLKQGRAYYAMKVTGEEVELSTRESEPVAEEWVGLTELKLREITEIKVKVSGEEKRIKCTFSAPAKGSIVDTELHEYKIPAAAKVGAMVFFDKLKLSEGGELKGIIEVSEYTAALEEPYTITEIKVDLQAAA